MKKTRRLLLLILGGMGVLYLAVAAVMAALSQTLSPLAMAEIDADAQTLPMLAIIFGGVGVILLTVGVSLFVGLGRGEKKRRDLLEFGQIVEGTVTDLRINYAVKVNQRSPWHVYVSCRHPQTYEQVTLRSHNVFAPAVQLGDKVRVAFDPMNERKYAIEIPERSAEA